MSDELKEVVDGEIIEGELLDDQSTTAQEEAPATHGDQLPEGVLKRFGTLTARNIEKDRKLAEKEQEIADLKSKLNPPAAEPIVPDFPDDELRYSDPAEYKKQIKVRDEKVIERATWAAQQSFAQQRATETRNQQATAQQQQHAEIVTGYIEGGLKQGISEEQMLNNESALRSAGLNQELAHFLYTDEHGAKLVDFLAKNPDELEALNAMHPTRAAIKIDKEIRARALATKPHVSGAPDPLNTTRGSGKKLADEWDTLAQGATFE